MEKVAKITIGILAAILIFYFIIKLNDNFYYMIKSILTPGVELIRRDEVLGSVYKISTSYFPVDSLIEYYWDGNYAIRGKINFNPTDSLFLGQMASIQEKFSGSRMTVSTISTGVNSIFLKTIYQDDTEMIITCVYDFINGEGLYIYGPDYAFDQACRLALIILYGKAHEYALIASEELLILEKHDENIR
jgi:hypothetical protein